MKITNKNGKFVLSFNKQDIAALNKKAQQQGGFSGDPDIYQQMGAPGVEDQFGDEPEKIGGSLLDEVKAIFEKHGKQMSPEMETLVQKVDTEGTASELSKTDPNSVVPTDIDGMTPKGAEPSPSPAGASPAAPASPSPTPPPPAMAKGNVPVKLGGKNSNNYLKALLAQKTK